MEIDISKLAETVMSDIEEIARAEMARVEDVIDTMADETCAQIKADSPAGGKYRSGWAIRKENKYGTRYRVVYNRKEPELTTIFEDGTADRHTKSGQFRGKIVGKPHIRPAFLRVVERHKKDLEIGRAHV